jgi:hypothetical protein
MGGGNVTIEEWLQPISSDSPCGPNLEYDADFLKLEEAARATPDQEFGRDGGEAIRIQGASADWREVQGLAESCWRVARICGWPCICAGRCSTTKASWAASRAWP